jgi:cyclopropane-fatty-acyl-phospholipid synthase
MTAQSDWRDSLAGAASFLEASSCVYPSGPSAAARSGGNETNMSMSFARKAVFRMLEKLRHGALEVICPERTYLFGEGGTGLRAAIAVHDERFFSRVLWGGDDAAGDSYVDGDWSSPDPVAVVRLAARNLSELEGGNPLLSSANRLFQRLRHRMNRNTVAGSRRNIQAHYDLSNDFFRLFLDRNMVYSSAVYRHAGDSLEEAQIEKLDRVCRKLRLGPDDHVLEIGTGWGAFALHASRNYGCRVTTTTISREQHDEARQLFNAPENREPGSTAAGGLSKFAGLVQQAGEH